MTSDLSKANLRGTDLGNLELSGAKLMEPICEEQVYGTNFSKADFSRAKLSDQAQPADFNGSILDGNFTGYDFSNADFRGSNLKPSVIFEDANFTAANLRNFSFTDSSGMS